MVRRISHAELAKAQLALADPYTEESDMRLFVATHHAVHLLSEESNQPIAEATKIKDMEAALAPTGHFGSVFDTFYTKYPRLSEQKFGNLATSLEAYALRVPFQATSKSWGMALLTTLVTLL